MHAQTLYRAWLDRNGAVICRGAALPRMIHREKQVSGSTRDEFPVITITWVIGKPSLPIVDTTGASGLRAARNSKIAGYRAPSDSKGAQMIGVTRS